MEMEFIGRFFDSLSSLRFLPARNPMKSCDKRQVLAQLVSSCNVETLTMERFSFPKDMDYSINL